jgi:hypothetical protein
MAAIGQLRNRSEALFTELLEEPPSTPFSWFDPEQATGAAALSFRLSAAAASKEDTDEALGAALDQVEAEMKRADGEQVRQGFAMFVTHNRDGRRLAKPRTVTAAPGLFNPPARDTRGDERLAISIGGLSPGLDYWREDPLANEHHQHWHEVYPYTGLPPRDFLAWIGERSEDELVAILNALQPDPGWRERIRSHTPAEVAGLFGRVAQADGVRGLPRELYRLLFHLNDRQGELFFYMHEQMLARYDAELLSAGLDRVVAFGPSQWGDPIAAGQDPSDVTGFDKRKPGRTLATEDADRLRGMANALDQARQGGLRTAAGGTVPIDRTNLGEAVEASAWQLHELDGDSYPGMHNSGHVAIARLSEPPKPGVMISTVTAIRDQAFWQWHKFIDGVSAAWQQDLAPYTFDDAPDVVLRDGQDIILCRTADLPAGKDPQQLGEELFGGDNWSDSTGLGTLTPVDQLITAMASENFGGKSIRHLTHEAFSYFIRVENRAAEALDVTVRIFLVPESEADDRRAWMEMDKFLLSLPAKAKVVAYRPDTESSIIKRPAEASLAAAQAGGGDPDENSYCDCGWPYTLLLPAGTRAGMPHTLLALCTDAKADGVTVPEHCGSMSYCGAVDRYPDSRDMGYPFCRPFAGPIEDTLRGLDSAALRSVTVRHVP